MSTGDGKAIEVLVAGSKRYDDDELAFLSAALYGCLAMYARRAVDPKRDVVLYVIKVEPTLSLTIHTHSDPNPDSPRALVTERTQDDSLRYAYDCYLETKYTDAIMATRSDA